MRGGGWLHSREVEEVYAENGGTILLLKQTEWSDVPLLVQRL